MADIDLFKTFIEVNRTGHFGRAAENLCITQSAVSARIKLLEEKLHVKLFTRQRNNLALTASGMKFLKYAESMVLTWAQVKQDIILPDTQSVSLLVGGVPSLWEPMLTDWIDTVLNQYPEIVFMTEVHSTEDLQRKIRIGSLDLAFLYEPQAMSEIASTRIGLQKLVLVSSASGISGRNLDSLQYIYVDWGFSFATQHAQYFGGGLIPGIRVSDGRHALAMLRRRQAAAYLPLALIQAELDTGTLHIVADTPEFERDVYAIYLFENHKAELIRTTLECFT